MTKRTTMVVRLKRAIKAIYYVTLVSLVILQVTEIVFNSNPLYKES